MPVVAVAAAVAAADGAAAAAAAVAATMGVAMAVAMAVAVVASSTASAQPLMAWCNGSIGRAVLVAPVLSLVTVSLAKRRQP